MENIENIWKELEKSEDFGMGFIRRRYSPDCKADIFFGIKTPERLRLLIVRVGSYSVKYIGTLPLLRGLRIEKIIDPEEPAKYILLTLILADKMYEDIFSELVLDIIEHIKNIENEKKLINGFLERLQKWQDLFEKYRVEGLSKEMQRGLYGEMCFMQKLFLKNISKFISVKSWTGPKKTIQDFQYKGWATEVKTSTAKQQQKIYITNERQLDDNYIEHLFLFHISLDEKQRYGELLPDIIEKVRNTLNTEPVLLKEFNNKLIEVGYFDNQIGLYEETGYIIREEKFYRIYAGFPRIIESNLPDGVGDIRYSIDISACIPYIINEQEVIETIMKNE